jgi:GMP synthase (glutamine-hydrolysing)
MVTIINLGSKKTPAISAALTSKGIQNQVVGENQFSFEQVTNSAALILSGSPVLLSEIPGREYAEYLIKYDFVKSLNIPVLGICFGHQLIGILHGGRIGKCTPDRDWQTIKQVGPHPVFDVFPKEYKMKQDHQEHVTVPPHFIHLGTSVICENEAMAHPVKKMLSVQYHPEVSEESGSLFFDSVIEHFGLKKG